MDNCLGIFGATTDEALQVEDACQMERRLDGSIHLDARHVFGCVN